MSTPQPPAAGGREEWWVMVGKDPDRPLDGPFSRGSQALAFAREHWVEGTQLIRMRPARGDRFIVASADPNDLS